MNTITSLLESFEKLAYKFLLAVIFIPKTVVQIIINPGWVTDYVREQLKQKDFPFNDYISPVMLLLAVALIPAIAIGFLPSLGTNMVAEVLQNDSNPSRLVRFEAQTRIASASDEIFNQYSWKVIRYVYDEASDSMKQDLIYKETYNEWTDTSVIEEAGSPSREVSGVWNTELAYPNNEYNTSQVSFYYEFAPNTSPLYDDYTVSYEIVSFYPEQIKDDTGNNYFEDDTHAVFDANGANKIYVLERYGYDQDVSVPAATEQDQQLILPSVGTRSEDKQSTTNLSDILKRETTIFLALGLLLPPLVFALATRLFTGVEISESSLKENFYTQCYYFSPLSVAIWATFYAYYFLTPDVFFYKGDGLNFLAVLLPALLAILWFIGVEIYAVARERPTEVWKSILIVTACLAILGFGGFRVYLFSQPFSNEENTLRRLAILLYPVGSAALLIGFVVLWWVRKGNEKRISRGEIVVGTVNFFVIGGVIVLLQLAALGNAVSSTSTLTEIPMATEPLASEIQEEPAATEELLAPSPTDTPVPEPEIQSFYTEEFDSNLDSWSSFLTSGVEDQVDMTLENGSLAFKIKPYQEKLAYYYLINRDFIYGDVQLDAVVTNQGNNANGVTLVCRFGEFGWYEFNISSSGFYEIWAFDTAGSVSQGYNLLANGGSGAIRAGFTTNTYTGVCKGNELTLIVNGTPVKTITDTKFNFVKGQIGIGVSSREQLPVHLQFDSLAITEPQ